MEVDQEKDFVVFFFFVCIEVPEHVVDFIMLTLPELQVLIVDRDALARPYVLLRRPGFAALEI